jgi:hypothetical protein
MNKEEARKIVQDHLSRSKISEDDCRVIMDEYTIERNNAFTFFYESSRYLESGDINDMLAGNAPIIVDKETGELIPTGTVHPIEYYLDNYEKYGAVYPPESD